MLKLEKYGNFKSLKKGNKKQQVVLCHTSREVDEYLTSLKFRYAGKYDRIPHFIITKRGEILQLIDEKNSSNFFGVENIDTQSVFVCLENLGWLEKKPITNFYINWNGTIYKEKIFEKKWRDYFFWDPYTSEQTKVTAELCFELCEKLQIEKSCVGHNTKIEGMSKFVGVSSRSNYDVRFTDLSPSFDFDYFLKHFENEQYSQREI